MIESCPLIPGVTQGLCNSKLALNLFKMSFFYNRLLEAAKNESIVRSQDVFSLVQYVSRNTYGKTMAWEWMTLNWDYLVNRFVHLTVERNREMRFSSY